MKIHMVSCHIFVQAVRFYNKFAEDQEVYYQGDLKQLSTVTRKQHMHGHELMENFKLVSWLIINPLECFFDMEGHAAQDWNPGLGYKT